VQKDRLDASGFGLLVGLQALFAFNQIIIVWVNAGLQPVFFAGLRSVLATVFLALVLRWRGQSAGFGRANLGAGLAIGAVFSAEFLLLFTALDLTTVGRASVIFYSMPVWFALLAHWGLGERITPVRAAGLVLAFCGTAIAILSGRTAEGPGSALGDLCALGAAIGWASTAFLARRPAMRAEGPERQLYWMVAVSGPLLLMASPVFGPLLRDPEPVHAFWLFFQASIVVTGGFILWLRLLAVYPPATVASFSFLSPILSLGLGVVFFDETVSPLLGISALLVASGIILVNRTG
jgi:drug/metabolite transporter (DMT)-like permease